MAEMINRRNNLLYSSSSRVTGATVTVSAGAATSIVLPNTGGLQVLPVPSSATLTATTTGYISPAYRWYTRFVGDSLTTNDTFTEIVGATSATLSVAWDSTFAASAGIDSTNPNGLNSAVEYKVVVTETTSNIGVNSAEYILSIPIIREATNYATVRIYKRTSTNVAPVVVQANDTTQFQYTFNTGTLLGGPAGWSTAIPDASLGAYLWVSELAVAGLTLTVSGNNSTWPAATLYTSSGTSGSSTAVVYAYKRTSTTPTDNPGDVVFDFSTAKITTATLANSWSKNIPSGTDPLWVIVASASSTSATDTVAASEWGTPVKFVENGLNTATVFLYARNNSSTTAPTLSTTGSTQYTFSNAQLSSTSPYVIPAGWSQTLPLESAGSVLWTTHATASSTSATDIIANTEWSTPRVLSVKGSDGQPGVRGTKQLYSASTSYNSTYKYNASTAEGPVSYATKATDLIAAAASGSVPTTPIAGDTVTFSNNVTSTFNGTISNYVLNVTSIATGSVQVGQSLSGAGILTGTVITSFISGTNGGVGTYGVSRAQTVSTSTTITGTLGDYVYTITYDGDSWEPPGAVIDGSLLVTGSITANKINSNGLSIKDAEGNVILAAGTNLDYSRVGGTKPPSDATNGATFGVNVSGKMSNASTYIEAAAISSALIGSLNADVINAGTLSADRIAAGSIVADKIDSRGLVIRDTPENGGGIILGAGTALDFANVGGDTKPAANANKTYVDSNGNIQGVSSGAGTEVSNASAENRLGRWQWLVNEYRTDSTINPYTTVPSYELVNRATLIKSIYAGNTSTSFSFNDENYFGVASCSIYSPSAWTWSVTVGHDDAGRIYVNGQSVYSSQIGSYAVSLSIPAGWSTIELMWAEQVGGDYFTLSQALSARTEVTDMWAGADLSGVIAAASKTSTWSGVSGNGKPEDGATVGAPAGTYVGSVPAQNVESQSGAQARADAAANWAVSTAQTYAAAQAELARITANAHADGIVSAAEQRAIDAATAKAAAAKTDAINAAAADATAKANIAATTANWSGVSGAGKPADGATSGSNLVRKPTFADGSMGSWGGSIVCAGCHDGLGEIQVTVRDTLETGNDFFVTPGETLFFAADIYTGGSSYNASAGVAFQNSSGQFLHWAGTEPLGPGQGWTRKYGSTTVPAGAVKATPWLQIDGPGGQQLPYVAFSQIYVGRQQEGATVGAPAGTYVGNMLAQNVEPSINAKLSKAGDTISGRINLSVADGIFAGTDINNGVYMGNGGLVGKKGGNTTFAIDTSGNATFGGKLVLGTVSANSAYAMSINPYAVNLQNRSYFTYETVLTNSFAWNGGKLILSIDFDLFFGTLSSAVAWVDVRFVLFANGGILREISSGGTSAFATKIGIKESVPHIAVNPSSFFVEGSTNNTLSVYIECSFYTSTGAAATNTTAAYASLGPEVTIIEIKA